MVCRRGRPLSIIKTRNDQALCLVKEDSGEESAEWIDVEDIETIEMLLNKELIEDDADAGPQIEDIQEWLSSPWILVYSSPCTGD